MRWRTYGTLWKRRQACRRDVGGGSRRKLQAGDGLATRIEVIVAVRRGYEHTVLPYCGKWLEASQLYIEITSWGCKHR